jgi:hypothetical protein
MYLGEIDLMDTYIEFAKLGKAKKREHKGLTKDKLKRSIIDSINNSLLCTDEAQKLQKKETGKFVKEFGIKTKMSEAEFEELAQTKYLEMQMKGIETESEYSFVQLCVNKELI